MRIYLCYVCYKKPNLLIDSPLTITCDHVVRVTRTGSIGSRCDYWVQMTSDRWVISCELPADNEINILCYLVIILALALQEALIAILPLQSGYVLEKKSICGQWEKSNCESNRSDVYLTEVSLALPFCLPPWETLHTSQNPSQKYTILFFHKMIFLYLSFIVNKRRDIRLKTTTD